jgi:sporulation protein YlmC with PRC-barrel domain
MLKTLAYATLFGTALVGSSALGADNPAVSQPGQASTQDAQPDRNQTAATNPQTPSDVSFVTTQEKTQWRAPKLLGVGVYGPDDKQIGKIDDLLIDHNGAVQTIVIGVGGFLGFGKKDVAVPFAAVQWRTEARKVPATDQPPANPVASTNGAGSQQPPMKETDPAATEASQGYPDKAILNTTLAQLRAAPDFQYAPSPLAESDTRPAGGGEMMKKTTP